MTEKRKPGAQEGNTNAKRVQHERIVLSLKEADFGAYIKDFQEQYGQPPDDSDLKSLLKRALREEKQENLHLYVKVKRQNAREVRREIERLFGQVRAISLRDSFSTDSDTGERTIYYQRILKTSEVYDPCALADWEAQELQKDDLTHEEVAQKVQELQANPLTLSVDSEITTNALPEHW